MRADACNTFRLWSGAPRPAAPSAASRRPAGRTPAAPEFPGRGSEGFERAYARWLTAHADAARSPGHAEWLACARRWTALDTDGDGVPDWRAIIDHRPAALLTPEDDDIDGDGAPNLLDPDPFDAAKRPPSGEAGVPRHLRMSGARAEAQATLLKEFGLLAVDHTARHGRDALEAIARFLRDARAARLVGPATSVRILYAFRGHDLEHESAAFHRELNAISLAGEPRARTGTGLSVTERARLLGAFAHELGHAFVFDRLGARELDRVARSFGGWDAGAADAVDMFSPALFAPHPLRALAARVPSGNGDALKFIADARWKQASLVSQYATSNAHEWFAEAFSAHLLARARRSATPSLRGPGLLLLPRRSGEYWVNHDNLASTFDAYLGETLQRLH